MKRILITNGDFSNRELRKCFSKKLLKIIEKLGYYSELSEEKVDDFFIKIEKMNLPQRLIRKLENIIPSRSKIKKIKKNNIDKFNLEYNQPRRCVICNERTVEHCHVIKTSFFRNHKRLGKVFRDFDWHPLNIVFLCPTHHSELDKHTLAKWRIRKVIRNRLKLRRKYTKDLEFEIRKMRKNIEKIDDSDRRINRYVKGEISRVVK